MLQGNTFLSSVVYPVHYDSRTVPVNTCRITLAPCKLHCPNTIIPRPHGAQPLMRVLPFARSMQQAILARRNTEKTLLHQVVLANMAPYLGDEYLFFAPLLKCWRNAWGEKPPVFIKFETMWRVKKRAAATSCFVVGGHITHTGCNASGQCRR